MRLGLLLPRRPLLFHPFIHLPDVIVEHSQLLRVKNLPDLLARLLAQSIKFREMFLIQFPSFGKVIIENRRDSLGLGIIQLQVPGHALNDSPLVELAVPMPGVLGVVVDGCATRNHTEQECEKKIDVSASAHFGF